MGNAKSDAKEQPKPNSNMMKWTVVRKLGGTGTLTIESGDYIKMVFYCRKGHPPPEYAAMEVMRKTIPFTNVDDPCPLSYRLERNCQLVLTEYESVPNDKGQSSCDV